MIHPALYASAYSRQRHLSRAICRHHSTQLALKEYPFASFSATPLGEDRKSEEGNGLGHRRRVGLGMGRQAHLLCMPGGGAVVIRPAGVCLGHGQEEGLPCFISTCKDPSPHQADSARTCAHHRTKSDVPVPVCAARVPAVIAEGLAASYPEGSLTSFRDPQKIRNI